MEEHPRARRAIVATAAAALAVAVIVATAVATGVVDRGRGCEPDDENCVGPRGTYYTVFGAPLTDQEPQAFYALGLSVLLFAVATAVHHATTAQLAPAYRVALAAAAYPLFFLLVVYLAPTVYVY
jgi:hypothetical protein